MKTTVRPMLPLALLASILLAACGGGDDDTSAAATAAAGTLTLSSATPAVNNTTIDLSTATSKGNSARTADGFSAVAYCELFWENATAANGRKYAVQVYFRQSDKAVLHTSVIENAFVVFNNDSGKPIAGVTVDTAAKTLSFTAKALSGSAGEVGTLSGTVGFPANATTAACGS
ncbi:MAG: hypothetical protein Q7U26_09705 [Aquabacterium sp.]|nr:hypothetical protein [Aquabacterium sp.]